MFLYENEAHAFNNRVSGVQDNLSEVIKKLDSINTYLSSIDKTDTLSQSTINCLNEIKDNLNKFISTIQNEQSLILNQARVFDREIMLEKESREKMDMKGELLNPEDEAKV